MYRQPYCGCIYSEKDRYYRQPQKKGFPNPVARRAQKIILMPSRQDR
jgi:predicted adenine nucleotide alpha hydrolase (AANH) superfamily ATPase